LATFIVKNLLESMSRKKFPQCNRYGCSEVPHLGGLCQRHHEEQAANERRREDALALLHRNLVDGTVTTNPEIRDEQIHLGNWWSRTCNSLNANRRDSVLQDEAEYAVDWCIAIATSLVDEERGFRLGMPSDDSLKRHRDIFWNRFVNLDAGLMSNGVARR
jgi:hypothetical protein